MKVTFVFNYMTQHQYPFAQAMYELFGDDFLFLETEDFEEERKNMGWDTDYSKLPYVRKYVSPDDDKVVVDSDIVMFGGVHFLYIRQRLEAGKMSFRCMERLYKKGRIHALAPKGYIRKLKEYTKYNNTPCYLLCCGAYVPADFDMFGGHKNKRLKWGYFTSLNNKDWYELRDLKSRQGEPVRILWTGRMLDWKHVLDGVKAFKTLIKHKKNVHMTVVGNGDEHALLASYIKENGLKDHVTMMDFMPASEVRQLMEQSDIYLMTSDYNEGWGAVVNEAMDSGCAVIASVGAGSAYYLIEDKKNGRIYKPGDIKSLAAIMEELTDDIYLRQSLGQQAHKTISEVWSPNEAAARFKRIIDQVAGNGYDAILPEYTNGPLSKAETILPGKKII